MFYYYHYYLQKFVILSSKCKQFSILFYFILIRVCMAEEPPRGSYAIKYVCMYV